MTEAVEDHHYVMHKGLNTRMDLVATFTRDKEYGIYRDMLQVLAKRLKGRIADHNQNVIVITGGTGTGKSNLAIQLARAIDPHWDLSENYIYSASDLARKLKHYQTASPISLYDEASVILNSLNFNRREDKAINALFDTMRTFGWTSILCLPSLSNLNGSIKDVHMTYHLDCPSQTLVPGYDRRGFFEVYYVKQYRWSKKSFEKCLGAGIHTKIPKQVAEEYDAIKLSKQLKLIDKFVKDNLNEDDEKDEEEDNE